MPTEVQTPQRKTQIEVGHPRAHLDVHPTHRGERSTAGALHPLKLDLEEPPEEVLVGFHPKEGLTNDHEAC